MLGFNHCNYFHTNVGFNWGLEFSQYGNTTLYRGAFRKEEAIKDKDGYYYLPIMECDYEEKRKVGAVEIPLLVRYRSNAGLGRASFFADAGAKAHLIAYANVKKEGTLESKGAYLLNGTNHFYLLDERDPSYGFQPKFYDQKEDLKWNKTGLSLYFAAGVKAKLTEFSDLVLSASYLHAMSDLTKNDKEEYENVFGEKSKYTPTKYAQMGLRVGVVVKL
jgi:hypothetical protein